MAWPDGALRATLNFAKAKFMAFLFLSEQSRIGLGFWLIHNT